MPFVFVEHEGPVLGWSQKIRLCSASDMDRPKVLFCPQASNPAAGLSFCAGIQQQPTPEGEQFSGRSVASAQLPIVWVLPYSTWILPCAGL